jgi:hypothetical protein
LAFSGRRADCALTDNGNKIRAVNRSQLFALITIVAQTAIHITGEMK